MYDIYGIMSPLCHMYGNVLQQCGMNDTMLPLFDNIYYTIKSVYDIYGIVSPLCHIYGTVLQQCGMNDTTLPRFDTFLSM